MGLFTQILTLPLAPVRATVAVAEQILRQAEDTYYDPVAIRAQLETVQRMRENGEITDEEADAAEEELIERLTQSGR
jgi:hypothetical protein